MPTRRSLAVGLGLLALAAGAYVMARETAVFAIDRVDVRGGSQDLDAQVQRALQPFVGRSLVSLDGSAIVRRVEALPAVVRASYDRAFPHTLRVTVVAERPVAVLRRGADAWLVSVRGRVVSVVAPHADPALPRIWVGAATKVDLGMELTARDGGAAARALGLAGTFAARVATASSAHGSLIFRLRSGIELRLGTPSAALHLKIAVAARALALLPSGSTFLDVSVPGRPVAGAEPSSRG